MRLTFLPTALLALANVVRSDVVGKRNLLQNLQDKAIEALKEAESNGAIGNRSECLISNAAVRQDW
jgi:tyrosinase